MPSVERHQLLCDDCDVIEDENVQTGRVFFPRRGTRNYYLTIINEEFTKWAVLIEYDDKLSTIKWNEYKCFINEDEDESYMDVEYSYHNHHNYLQYSNFTNFSNIEDFF
jgi:hypothetical protein